MSFARSLESLGEGEVATVERILFESLRSHCAQRGIREGQRVSGAAGEPGASVLVATTSGAVPCERRYARFVQVTAGADPVEGAYAADTPAA